MDSNFVRCVGSPEEMISLGEELAGKLSSGSILALQGGLGAGKTHFTKGVALGLDCTAEVTSPTFTLAHEYTGGRLPLYHFDFYRMDSESEVLRIGWDEYLGREGLFVVEWGEKAGDQLPARYYQIRFNIIAEHQRDISVSLVQP